jgi:hypothetical protein
MSGQMMDFQTPLPPLSGIVRISEPPSPRTSAMPRKNSHNLVYVKSKKLFLLLELFLNFGHPDCYPPPPYVRVCPDFPTPPPPLGSDILCEWPLRHSKYFLVSSQIN